jgi:AhpD family alkylhydroperoxidase
LECLGDLLRARKSGNVDKAFTEKIMLAVTEVNGCRYCNYVHTKKAVDAGVSQEDIQVLLSGQFEDLSPDEAHALLFAQHYADSGGKPDSDTYQNLIRYYGAEKARDIMALIKAIMVGNIYGLSVDAVLSRIKGNALPGSRLKDEISIAIGMFPAVPIVCVRLLFNKVFRSSDISEKN